MRLALTFLLLLLTVPASADAAGPGRLDHVRAFPSRYVEPRNVSIWLPPGYRPDGPANRVLYMHDGQNLFDPATGYGGKEWGVDEALSKLIEEKEVPPTIVVGIWNTPRRLREYVPAKAFDRLPRGYLARVRGLYGGDPLSDLYLRFVTRELKPFVDAHYRTCRDAAGTAIMGSSMGGLISLYALSEYPHVFGAAGALSTHWPLLLPREGEALSDTDVDTVATAFEAYLRPARPRRGRHRIWFDHGSETLDRHYARYQSRIDRLVAERGWRPGTDFVSRNFPGAAHNEDAWQARVHLPLRFLLGGDASRRD